MKLLLVSVLAAITLLAGCGSIDVRFADKPTVTRHFQLFRICQMGDSGHDSVSGPRGSSARSYDIVKCSFVDDYGRRCEARFEYTSDMRVDRSRGSPQVTVPEEYVRRHMLCSYDKRRRW